MFTGIVEGVGTIFPVKTGERKSSRSRILSVLVPKKFMSLRTGQSLAVNGACLTVASKRGSVLSFDLLRETERRTMFESLKPGDSVNLERAMRLGSRLEGHFVLGHVDGTGVVRRIVSHGKEKTFFITQPIVIKRYIMEKGSIAVNGVSLTIGQSNRSDFSVHCIPHTLKSTNLGFLKVGRRVNLEADVLIKHFIYNFN